MTPRKRELPGAPSGEACTILHEGEALTAKKGEPLMVTLLAHGIDTASRSIKYHRPRGAFCMNGSCGQCWMRIDDLPNRPACLTPAVEGRSIGRQNAFPSADVDLFRAADLVFGGGFDHHRLATTPLSPLNAIMQGTARQLAGLGELSEQTPGPAPRVVEQEERLVIVGSGPAGLAAALEARALSPLVLEARESIGGQLRSGLFSDVPELAGLKDQALRTLGDRLWCRAAAVGLYRDERGPQLLVKKREESGERLVVIRPQQVILATGGYEQSLLFGDNDLPGHYGVRALAELMLVHGVAPGSRLVIHDGGAELGPRLYQTLKQRGLDCQLLDRSTKILRAEGRSRVKGLELEQGGQVRKLDCDVIASSLPTAPAYELAQQAGASLAFKPGRGFVVVADSKGHTEVPWLRVAGELAGADSALAAAASGKSAALGLGETA
ncbi:MAG: (2Fe-2S)-binding protein [Deltaproteobacteria bacterium]|nr:(2Fe-2S)-binding protein [Deltaproteobacteria bacterium]